MIRRSVFLAVVVLLCLIGANITSGAENTQQGPAQDAFRMFQGVMIGLVAGDANAVLKGATTRFVKEIVDGNRKTFFEYKDDPARRAAFEKYTGKPYAQLLSMPDRELAIVVIDKLIPLTRTEAEKTKIITQMRQAVLRDAKPRNNAMVLTITYPDATQDTPTFIKESGTWRLDTVK